MGAMSGMMLAVESLTIVLSLQDWYMDWQKQFNLAAYEQN